MIFSNKIFLYKKITITTYNLYIDIIMICLRKALCSSLINAITVWIPFIHINDSFVHVHMPIFNTYLNFFI